MFLLLKNGAGFLFSYINHLKITNMSKTIEEKAAEFAGKYKENFISNTLQADNNAYVAGIEVGFIWGQKEYEEKLRWIPVEEKLPEKQGHYLVKAPKSFPKNCIVVVAEFYEDNNTFYSESSDCPIEDATHWRSF